jgi:hypothetical protein
VSRDGDVEAAVPCVRVGVSPSTILPECFEDFEGFRETTLAVFTDPQANALVRGFGELLYSLGQDSTGGWPHEPDGSFFHQVRAVVADLRHLEGWLGHLDGMRGEDLLSSTEVPLSVLCGSLLPSLKAIGDALEGELRKLKAEK